MAVKTYAGGRLFGERHGTGLPQIVALHGWGRTRTDFGRVLAGRDGVALDLPGFGATPPPPEPVGTGWYRDAVIGMLEELGDPVVLLGHSFGGRIAVQVAAARPDLVTALVLVGAPLLPRAEARTRKPAFAYRVLRLGRRLGVVTEGRLEAARRRYGSADYAAVGGVMRGVLVTVVGESYEHLLDRIAVPVHLVWGRDDREVPVEVARRAAGRLVDAELTILDDVGHHVPTECPEALTAVLDRLGV